MVISWTSVNLSLFQRLCHLTISLSIISQNPALPASFQETPLLRPMSVYQTESELTLFLSVWWGGGGVFCLFSFPSELKVCIADGVRKCNFPLIFILLSHVRKEASGTHRIVNIWETKGLSPRMLPGLVLLCCMKSQKYFSHLGTCISYHRNVSYFHYKKSGNEWQDFWNKMLCLKITLLFLVELHLNLLQYSPNQKL